MNSDIPVVVLCGGRGVRLNPHTKFTPKPLIKIGQEPIVSHIMKTYYYYGFNNFIFCLGYLGERIREHFNSAGTPRLSRRGCEQFPARSAGQAKPERESATPVKAWVSTNYKNGKISFIDTGLETNTGGRIRRIKRYIKAKTFMATYGDCVADINLKELLSFHRSKKRIATLTAVKPISPFGIIDLRKDKVVNSFSEKPVLDSWINGGFFVFEKEVFDYIGTNDVLEKEVFSRLVTKSELVAYQHRGFWKCLDTYKDDMELNEIWKSGNAPWAVWEKKK